ncbi:metal-dependent hydrolase [Thermogladius calderae]|uniref:metal-dependent hydrolase n=1 Tax=Thermogladius calderae TaxID=1200300 RepID=UPI000693351B|nr:metal-dependent hydrolase [Thermogladius calderae]
MRRLSHAMVGFSTGLLVGRISVSDVLLLSILGVLGSVFPDFDLRYAHRIALHNLLSSGLVSLGLYSVLAMAGVDTRTQILGTACFLAGWLSHLLLDSLTLRGVALLYPFSRRMYGPRLLKSGDWRGEALAWVISGLLIYAALKTW